MPQTLDKINELYKDSPTCAKLIGLEYIDTDSKDLRVPKKRKELIKKLVVPPAWKEVWLCTSDKGHILATGVDERGRKQYIYHPKWRTMRDLIKFYRMISFGIVLPKIRKQIDRHLDDKGLSRDRVIAAMLWILDNAYIRIGNDVYFTENESVGLTTLTDKHVIIAGPVITFNFKGKSGKDQQITVDNPKVAATLRQLKEIRGPRLFRYRSHNAWHNITSVEINKYLHEVTQLDISAKDFRTWGGTLMAFMHLIEEDAKSRSDKKPEKVVIEAVDQAAAVLGNTRAVARSSYVHPHLLSTYAKKDFGKYYSKAVRQRKLPGLDSRESELLHLLQDLFKTEFDLLSSTH